MASGNDGVYPVCNTTQEDRAADIVFVHGLGGSSHDTWRHGVEGASDYFFWPEELGKDLNNCGIWTVGYPAGFTRLGLPGMIIEKRAGNLALKLANWGIGSRPLIFICHSMGGLIVKSLVTESQTNADEDRRQITKTVGGIIFCATPHRGSAFADAAGVLGQMFLGTQAHLDEMRANAEPLDLLHDRFIEWHRRTQIPIESYAESIGLFRTSLLGRPLPLGLVVPRASANTGIAGSTVKDVDADHITLVKPSNRQSDVYAGTLRFIRKLVQARPSSAPAQEQLKPAQTSMSPLHLFFSERAAYPVLHFSIANEGKETVQLTSVRAVVAAKAVDNHTGMEHLLGTRMQLNVDINCTVEGGHAELLGDRVISLRPGEIEAFSLRCELENTVALLDIDIDYVQVGARKTETYSPQQVILIHAPIEKGSKTADGSISLVDRADGLRILTEAANFDPWSTRPFRDCRNWRYALARGAGCFLIGDVERLWPILSPLLDDKYLGGPVCASVAETALRRSLPRKIVETLRLRVTNPDLAKKLGISDNEAYAVTIAKSLDRLSA
jgi:pimeloyl-ACP methyl ester carboxylesterase